MNYSTSKSDSYFGKEANMSNDLLQLLSTVAAGFTLNGSTPSMSLPQNCGDLRSEHNGQFVELTGKLTKKSVTRFAELRDRSGGSCQLVILEDKYPRIARRIRNMPSNVNLTIMGQVMLRPQNSRNPTMSTGDIEVEVQEIGGIQFLPGSKRAGDKRAYMEMAKSRVTNVEKKMSQSDSVQKYFENRDLTCGDLRRDDVGTTVTLVGWIPFIKSNKFLQLKDGHGQTQLTVDDVSIMSVFTSAQMQSVFQIVGKVVSRPPVNVNLKYVTGEIEVCVTSAKVINPYEPYEGPIKSNIKQQVFEDGSDGNGENAAFNEPRVKVPDINRFAGRTHHCGELSFNEVNQNVVICGWLAFQRMNKFFILKDAYGKTQVIVMPKTKGLEDYVGNDVPVDTLLLVEGTVFGRPPSTLNPKMLTGDIEVKADRVTVLQLDNNELPKELQIKHEE
ncbi:uncharacterized protein Dana_GF14536 [Drosophila ananassae]|uniref:Uncharacterized protein n=1 Tax=Drosophila ananassae TaxID=7217 RepID=B3MK53_DROAN|nr:uncharacterized protein LOC6497359 [Drosophila ananassae]EDV31471.2 uncharacterized protein Dana_GF14536 [Drosophila ananassae]